MNGFSTTTSADLPWNSRYVGTTSYEMMTQNAGFLPMTNNPFAAASPSGLPWNTVGALPAQSLGGDINTLLYNGVITTKITPELTNKLTYRYYDFDNQTPRIIEPCWIAYDGTGTAPTAGHLCGPAGFEGSISSLSISYIKQNAGEELNWRPTKEWNFTVAGGWEGYNYSEADAGYTNEYSIKGSVDWKPMSWLTARASGYYSDRTAGNYNYLNNVADIQFPIFPNATPQCAVLTSGCAGWVYSSAYQQFMFDNRQRTTADFLLDVTSGCRRHHHADLQIQGRLLSAKYRHRRDCTGGCDCAFGRFKRSKDGQRRCRRRLGGHAEPVDRGFLLLRLLSPEAVQQLGQWQLTNNCASPQCGLPDFPAGRSCRVTTIDNEFVNTATVAVKWAAIPNTLDFDAALLGLGRRRRSRRAGFAPGATFQASPSLGTPFPNDTTLFQRVDATATYRFDPTWVQQMGFKGDILARLRYTWESNSVAIGRMIRWRRTPTFRALRQTRFGWPTTTRTTTCKCSPCRS